MLQIVKRRRMKKRQICWKKIFVNKNLCKKKEKKSIKISDYGMEQEKKKIMKHILLIFKNRCWLHSALLSWDKEKTIHCVNFIEHTVP